MVEGTRLEIERGVKLTVGSNPTLSASQFISNKLYVFIRNRGHSRVVDFVVFCITLCH